MDKLSDIVVDIIIFATTLSLLTWTQPALYWWTVGVAAIVLYAAWVVIYEVYDTFVNQKDARAPPFTVSAVANSVFNIVLLCSSALWFYRSPSGDVNYSIDWLQAFVILCVWALWTEVVFYTLHRIAHHRWFYVAIHKQHHTYSVTRPLYCQYLSVWESVLVNIPSVNGFLLLYLPHPYIAIAVTAMFVYNNVSSHRSMHVQPGRHAMHHMYNNCNYGNSQLMDSLLGTERNTTTEPLVVPARRKPRKEE